jgi:hypothetical protein
MEEWAARDQTMERNGSRWPSARLVTLPLHPNQGVHDLGVEPAPLLEVRPESANEEPAQQSPRAAPQRTFSAALHSRPQVGSLKHMVARWHGV